MNQLSEMHLPLRFIVPEGWNFSIGCLTHKTMKSQTWPKNCLKSEWVIENQCRKSFVTESDSLQPPRHAGYRVYGRFFPDPSTSREVMHALAPLTLVLNTAHQNDWLTRLIAERSLYYVSSRKIIWMEQTGNNFATLFTFNNLAHKIAFPSEKGKVNGPQYRILS